MAVLKVTLAILCAGCYAPDAPDCVLACSANTDCISGQACTTDRLCAGPSVTTCGVQARMDGGSGMAIDAQPGQTEIDLTVSGAGTVQSSTGDTCTNPAKPPIDCTFQAPTEQDLTLTAIPPPGKALKEWTGACIGQSSVCHTTPTGAMIVVGAKFM
ncbi:hypothetical protein BH11MYX1_BH11MYX1_39620 [soil metagenome]